jgi:hypothetical protein
MLSPHNSFKWACYSVILPIKVLLGRLTHLTDYGVESWHASSNCKSCTKGSRISWHRCMKLRVEPAHPQLKTLIIISLAWMVNNNCSSLSLFNTTLFSENLFNKECAFCVWGGEFDTQMFSLDVLRWCIQCRERDRERDCHWMSIRFIHNCGFYDVHWLCRNGNKEVLNTEAGYLLRTKSSQTNEGGVAAGYAVLDSVHLI